MIRRALLGVALLALLLPPLWYVAFPTAAPDLPAAGRRVEVAPGVHVNAIAAGEGPPVVLVHGHPGSAYDWAALMPELAARGRRVIAYDRVGYGRSDARLDGDFSVDANARELLGFLGAEDLHDVTLVGWSYGGGASMVATRQDPSRVRELVLLGSVGPRIGELPAPPSWLRDFVLGPVMSWVRWVPPLGSQLEASFLDRAFHPAAVPPDARSVFAANFARSHSFESMRSEGRDLGGAADLDPSRIERPILVVHGEADQMVPLFVAEEIHRRAPRSKLLVVPGGGHVLPATHPVELAEWIVRGTKTDS